MSCGSTHSLSRSCCGVVSIPKPPARQELLPRRSLTSRWIAAMCRMIERRNQRRLLAELDDRMLADIGLVREDAMREANKPFWRCAVLGDREDQP